MIDRCRAMRVSWAITKNLYAFSGGNTTRSMPPSHPKFDLSKLRNPQSLIEIINQQHSMKQTLKILKAIQSGSAGINKSNFEPLFKKYVYYVTQTFKQQKFMNAQSHEKLQFLKLTTSIYEVYGKVSSAHLIKTFNKVSDLLLKNRKNDDCIGILENQLEVLRAVSCYNQKKATALFKVAETRYVSSKNLNSINIKSAVLYLDLMSKMRVYNRLIVEACVDALYPAISQLNITEVHIIANSLAYSYFPVNKTFFKAVLQKFDYLSNSQHSIIESGSLPLMKTHLHILSCFALIQANMNLTSAYFGEMDKTVEINSLEMMNCLKLMKDQHLRKYCDFIRRSAYYNEAVLENTISEIMGRQIKQINQINEKQGDIPQLQDKRKPRNKNDISINTVCAALHMLALLNCQNKKFIKYAVDLLELLSKTSQLSKYLQPKYYSRTMWSLCVLANKQNLIKSYGLITEYFELLSSNKLSDNFSQLHEMLNFYYCFLLLKTCLPQISQYLPIIKKTLNSQNGGNKLLSTISVTHQQIYAKFIEEAGIPCLSQFQINNLMCDIFIPQYKSQNLDIPKTVSNVVIDIHGYHHFTRNENRLKGGSFLKARLLEEQGYIYHYIPIDEWTMIKQQNSKQYLVMMMDTIAKRYGKTEAQQFLDRQRTMIGSGQEGSKKTK